MTGCNNSKFQQQIASLRSENEYLQNEITKLKVENEKLKENGSVGDLSRIKKLIENQNPSLLMLNATPIDYSDKKIVILAYATLSDYYNYEYKNAVVSHYSVQLTEGLKSVHVYFRKKGNENLFKMLGPAKYPGIPLKVESILLYERWDYDQGSYLGEGLNWSLLE